MHVASTYNTHTNFPACIQSDFVGSMFELENCSEDELYNVWAETCHTAEELHSIDSRLSGHRRTVARVCILVSRAVKGQGWGLGVVSADVHVFDTNEHDT